MYRSQDPYHIRHNEIDDDDDDDHHHDHHDHHRYFVGADHLGVTASQLDAEEALDELAMHGDPTRHLTVDALRSLATRLVKERRRLLDDATGVRALREEMERQRTQLALLSARDPSRAALASSIADLQEQVVRLEHEKRKWMGAVGQGRETGLAAVQKAKAAAEGRGDSAAVLLETRRELAGYAAENAVLKQELKLEQDHAYKADVKAQREIQRLRVIVRRYQPRSMLPEPHEMQEPIIPFPRRMKANAKANANPNANANGHPPPGKDVQHRPVTPAASDTETEATKGVGKNWEELELDGGGAGKGTREGPRFATTQTFITQPIYIHITTLSIDRSICICICICICISISICIYIQAL